MRLLFVCRGFAPDNVIGAVRETKLVKYLLKQGHDVTVISSGLVSGKFSKETLNGLERAKLFYYESEKTILDNRLSKEKTSAIDIQRKNNNRLLRTIKKFVHWFYDPFYFYNFEDKLIRKKILSLYNNNKSLKGFDAVISTFSPLGCVSAGRIISQKEGSAFFIDFRDLMTNTIYTPILRQINKRTQKKYVKAANAVFCVSQGNVDTLKKLTGKNENVYYLNNGYDLEEQSIDVGEYANQQYKKDNQLVLCYTGTLYGGTRDLKPLFKAISVLKSEKGLSFLFYYAGKEGMVAKKQADEYGVGDVVVDYGFVSRSEAQVLQNNSDIFVVSTWNTKKDLGILTGKFYDSLLCKKPVVGVVSGGVPNSELAYLINKYNLGVCYEEVNDLQSFDSVLHYLEDQFNNKKKFGEVIYKPNDDVFENFDYKRIAERMSVILKDNMMEAKK